MTGPRAFRVNAEVQAWQVADDNYQQVAEWCGASVVWGKGTETEAPVLFIDTPKGQMCALLGDWVIQGTTGGFFPSKPLVFDQTYEAVV